MSTLQDQEITITNKTVPIGQLTTLTAISKTNPQSTLTQLMMRTQDTIKPRTFIQRCMQIKKMKKLPGSVTQLRSLLTKVQTCSHLNLPPPSSVRTPNITEPSSISTPDLSILLITDVLTLKCILSILLRTPSTASDTQL